MDDTLKQYYTDLHSAQERYGSTSHRRAARYIADFLAVRTQVQTCLDVGAGKETLKAHFAEVLPRVAVTSFDPAIPGIDKLPKGTFDAVVSTDVAEHIPEEDLPEFFATYGKATRCAAFYIAQTLTGKLMPDGRDLHVTVKPTEWWIEKISQHTPPNWLLVERADVKVFCKRKATGASLWKETCFLGYDILPE